MASDHPRVEDVIAFQEGHLVDDAGAVEAHVASCSSCQAEVAAFKAFDAVAKKIREILPCIIDTR